MPGDRLGARPALRYDFGAPEESDAVLAIFVEVPESGILPAAMAKVAERRWRRIIDAHHRLP